MYKCKKRQLDYLRRWREKNKTYMSDYYWREVKPLRTQNRPHSVAGSNKLRLVALPSVAMAAVMASRYLKLAHPVPPPRA